MESKGLAKMVHSMKNRVRLRIPSAKGNQEYLQRLSEFLAKQESVWRVEGNSLTGSLLIFHEGDWTKIAQSLENNFPLRIVSEDHDKVDLRSILTGSYLRMNEKIRKASVNLLDLTTLLAVFFLVLGFNEVRKGRLHSPPWYVALVSAITLLRKNGS